MHTVTNATTSENLPSTFLTRSHQGLHKRSTKPGVMAGHIICHLCQTNKQE